MLDLSGCAYILLYYVSYLCLMYVLICFFFYAVLCFLFFFFFFSSRRRHTRSTRDWSSDVCSSDLFHAVLRLDRVLCAWPDHWQQLAREGYAVDEDASGKSVAEVRRFLADWQDRKSVV